MAGITLGLGKGLDALIRETGGARETGGPRDSGGVHKLPLGDIMPNPNQPRRKFSEKALEELAASIASQGLLQPILVRPLGEGRPGKYEIIAGERRWRACKIAGLVHIPVVVRSFNDQETLAAALIENLQREDLNPIEEALGVQMLKEEFGLSQEDLARRLGKSRPAVANCLRLLTLPEHCRKDIAEGKLSAGHARALLSVTQERAQEYLRNLILEENLSVREAEGLAATWKDTGNFMPELFVSGPGAKGASNRPGDAPDDKDAAAAENQTPEEETAAAHRDEAAEMAASFAPPRPPAVRRPQSARLLEIQNRLHSALSVPVRVTGQETRGKISLSYGSKAELEALLARLGGTEGAAAPDIVLAEATAIDIAAGNGAPVSPIPEGE